MYKVLYIILFSLIVANCSFKKVVKHHGVPFLEKKQETLIVNQSNKNDIKKLLGYPSSTSKFDNDIWIYIERRQTQSNLKHLGRMKIYKNDVLVLEINDYGILQKKEFYNQDDMNKLKVAKDKTETSFSKRAFIYDFLSSMRQKINDPLGKKAKVNQQ